MSAIVACCASPGKPGGLPPWCLSLQDLQAQCLAEPESTKMDPRAHCPAPGGLCRALGWPPGGAHMQQAVTSAGLGGLLLPVGPLPPPFSHLARCPDRLAPAVTGPGSLLSSLPNQGVVNHSPQCRSSPTQAAGRPRFPMGRNHATGQWGRHQCPCPHWHTPSQILIAAVTAVPLSHDCTPREGAVRTPLDPGALEL